MLLYLQPFLKKDLVAQPVEHLPFKERVLGSNPSQITFLRSLKIEHLARVLELADRHDLGSCAARREGSIPSVPISSP